MPCSPAMEIHPMRLKQHLNPLCDRTRATSWFERVRWPQDAVRTNAGGFCLETTPFLLGQKILCSVIARFWCIASESAAQREEEQANHVSSVASRDSHE